MSWIDKHLLSKEHSDKRWNICLNCEHFINLTKSCSKCNCIMPAKVKLPLAECPIGKWKKYTETN